MDQDFKSIFSLKGNWHDFRWYKRYIEIVKDYPFSSDSREKMVAECTKYCQNNKEQQKNIGEFRDKYTPETSIR